MPSALQGRDFPVRWLLNKLWPTKVYFPTPYNIFHNIWTIFVEKNNYCVITSIGRGGGGGGGGEEDKEGMRKEELTDSIPTRSGGRGTRPPVGEKRYQAAMPPGLLAWALVCPSSWTLVCPSSWTLVCPLSSLVPLCLRGFELDLAFLPCIFQHFHHNGGKFYPAKGRVCTPIRPIIKCSLP